MPNSLSDVAAAPARAQRINGSKIRVRFAEASAIITSTVMINLLSLAVPLGVLMIYDRIIPNQSFPTLAVLIFGISVIVGIDLILRLVRLSLEARVTARLDHLARTRHVEALLAQRHPMRTNMSLNDLLGKLAQSLPGRERKLLRIKCIADIPFAFAFLCVIGLITGDLVLLPISVCLVFGVWAYILAVMHRRSSDRLRSESVDKPDFVDRTFDSLAQIKTLGAEVPILHRLSRLYERQAFRFRKQKQYSMTIGNVYSLFSQLMIGGVVVAGSFAVLEGNLSHGGLAAFTLLAGRALEPMRSVYELVVGARPTGDKTKYNPLLRENQFDVLSGAADKRLFKKPPEITAKCTVQSETASVILKLDLVVQSGEAVAITSTESAGKSVLAYSLLGLVDYKGSVKFNNTILDANNAEAIRNEITVLGRVPQLPRGTMMDVLSWGQEERYADVRYLCHLIGLDVPVKRLPDGYNTVLGDDPTKLPSGLLQQVAIVRGLAANNKVIIVDDATLSLDAGTELKFAQILKMLRKTATIIVLSDRPSLTSICDRHEVLKDYQLVAAHVQKEA
ncbi:ATP-binding cassette domain-containing protein [Thalassospira lucentensis]|uniref:ATP-binding cassette domain-containing protein n=1 Tax=Thalassospira lucentensis TaxID=168935 RepID=UPI003D2EFB78